MCASHAHHKLIALCLTPFLPSLYMHWTKWWTLFFLSLVLKAQVDMWKIIISCTTRPQKWVRIVVVVAAAAVNNRRKSSAWSLLLLTPNHKSHHYSCSCTDGDLVLLLTKRNLSRMAHHFFLEESLNLLNSMDWISSALDKEHSLS